MFQFRGDANPRHNIPEVPILNPIEGVLLAVGLGTTLARARKWPQAVWLGWFVVMLLPAILTIEAPQAHRAVGAIPAVYFLIGEGLQILFVLAAGDLPKGLRKAVAVVALFAVSFAASARDLSLYFRVQVRDPMAWDAFEAEHHAIGQFIKPFGNRYDVWVNPLYFDYPIEKFYLGADFPYRRFRLFEHLPISPTLVRPERQGLLYVLEPFQAGLFPLVHSLYPHAALTVHRDPFGREMFIDIQVPREDLEHLVAADYEKTGFWGAYYQNGNWAGEPAIERREPAIWFHTHWHEDILAHPFTGDWASYVEISQPGEYAFELVTSGPTTVSFDRHRVFTTTTVDNPAPQLFSVYASAGKHLLVVSYHEVSSRATIALSWRPPQKKTEVIPLDVLHPLTAEEYDDLRPTLSRPAIAD